jgi:hypothetical protein
MHSQVVLSNIDKGVIIIYRCVILKPGSVTNYVAILLMKNEYTIKSALDFLESWIKISGYPYRHQETNNGHCYSPSL